MQTTGNAGIDTLVESIESAALEFQTAVKAGDDPGRLAADERLAQAIDNLYSAGSSLGISATAAFIILVEHPYRTIRSIARDVLEDIGTPEALAAAERAKPTPEETEMMRQALKNRKSQSG